MKAKTKYYPLRKGFNDALGYSQLRDTIEKKNRETVRGYKKNAHETVSGRTEVVDICEGYLLNMF